MDGRRRVSEPKRIKVTGVRDDWTGFVVTCDGQPLEVVSVSLNVTVSEMNTVTLVLDGSAVEFDIQTPSDAEFWVRDDKSA